MFFVKENIHSLGGDGELMLTILASYAQEESHSVPENIKWRIRKRFEKGELVSVHKMYGYNTKKGVIEINEEPAAVIRMVFEDYIGGMGFCREDYNTIIETLTDTSALDKEAAELEEECTVVMELIRKAVEDNARYVQDQEWYQKRNAALIARYDAATNRLDEVADEKLERKYNRESIAKVLEYLKEQDCLLTDFDEEIWYMTIESVTVHSEKKVAFTFKTGTEMDVDVRGK